MYSYKQIGRHNDIINNQAYICRHTSPHCVFLCTEERNDFLKYKKKFSPSPHHTGLSVWSVCSGLPFATSGSPLADKYKCPLKWHTSAHGRLYVP